MPTLAAKDLAVLAAWSNEASATGWKHMWSTVQLKVNGEKKQPSPWQAQHLSSDMAMKREMQPPQRQGYNQLLLWATSSNSLIMEA